MGLSDRTAGPVPVKDDYVISINNWQLASSGDLVGTGHAENMLRNI